MKKDRLMEYTIVNGSGKDMTFICDKLVEFNLKQVPKTQEKEFVNIIKKILDEDNNIIAGCYAKMYCWNVIYIDILWVDERYRKHGLGSKLLEEIEKIAKEQNCSLIHLDTFDFQAKDFYLRQGYEVFGVLEDCPQNHCRYYLKKKV